MLKTISNFYVVTLLFCTLTIGLILSSSHVSSASTTADAAVTVGSACTMTATVDTPHNAEIPNGTNRTEIGTTTLNTICNDSGGFAIYAVGYSNNEYGNTTMINQADSSITFNTGTATSGSNSNWSMKLSQVTTGTFATTIDNSFNNYHNVPNTYTKVAHRDSATDAVSANPATGTSISATYQTFISPTQAAGTYQGKVKYTMVHPADSDTPGPKNTSSGQICYYPNGSDVIGTMGCQTIGTTEDTTSTSAMLLASNFSRNGYGFAGWSTTYDYSDTNGFLGPQEDITFEEGQYSGNNPGLSLYAHWIKSKGSIQNWTGCSALTQGAVTALTDQRDNETYAVAKLADGRCWMIENFRLEAENTIGNTNKALAQGYNESINYGSFIGLANAEYSGFTSTYTPNSLYYSGTQEGTASANIGATNYPYLRMPRYNNTNTHLRVDNPTSNNLPNDNSSGIYSYGNYYSWPAAIANTASYTTLGVSISHTSICPSGWHIPVGGDKTKEAENEYWQLIVEGLNNGVKPANYDNSTPYYSGEEEGGPLLKKSRAYPNNFIYGGSFVGSAASNRGKMGRYWTNTVSTGQGGSGGASLFSISVSNQRILLGNSGVSKYLGLSIRCIADN